MAIVVDVEPKAPGTQRWYQGLTPYQWWVFAVGAMAWLLDCTDQRLFLLARSPALSELLGVADTDPRVVDFGTYATAATMAGWGIGGLCFGVLGDRWGRAKTLAVSVLTYSLFTGLCGFARGGGEFCFYRFLMGGGIGGAFATAAALVAESVPPHSRPVLMGLFSALSLFGNMSGSVIGGIIQPQARYLASFVGGDGVTGWRLLFFVGAFPALLVVLIMRTIRESDQWLAARANRAASGGQMKELRQLWEHPRWRRSTWVAISLATAGIVGVWGVGFWSPELIKVAMKGVDASTVATVKANGTILQDLGGFLGILVFTAMATRWGRRPTFALAFVTSFASICYVFLTLSSATQAYVLLPIMGFFTISVMGGFVIYFPEIYPTRLRATGTAIGYNLARLSAAALMLAGNPMREALTSMGVGDPFRVGMVSLASVYLLGLVVLIWAPETRGQPLPED